MIAPLSGTEMVKSPDSFVEVPVLVFFNTTDTPCIGSPVDAFVIFPLTFTLVNVKAYMMTNKMEAMKYFITVILLADAGNYLIT
jgi:hypothetical protein